MNVQAVPQVVGWFELAAGWGHGWIETGNLVEEIVWLRGHVLWGDGCLGLQRMEQYGRLGGWRVWTEKPTRKQRAAVPWGTGI